MKAVLGLFKRALAARLLLLFVGVSVCITILIIGSMVKGLSSQWELGIKPHLEQYLRYVNDDIGNPPDLSKAQALADKLPINVYVKGQGVDYSSTGEPLDLDGLAFDRPRRRWRDRDDGGDGYGLALNGQQVSFGEHRERTVLRNQLGDYVVYYELPHTRHASHRDGAVGTALWWLAGILLLAYWLLKRMLRPVQDIQAGVRRMGQGELTYRVPVRADNDLGELVGSINQMAADITTMLDAKRQLLLGFSHELRSPLTRARIAGQMLDPSPNQARILDDLDEMERLITDILETERLKASHAPLNRSDVDVRALIDAVIADVAPEQIRCTVDDLGRVSVDEPRLRLLLRNLIANAVRYSAEAANQPELAARRNAERLEISVRDEGPGIDPEHLEHITEPFYRVDPSRTRATGGVGLGLYLARLIAEAHDGELHIDSAIGKGTTVTITLPVSV